MNGQEVSPCIPACCSICGYKESEIQALECGCSFHTRCFPVNTFAQYRQAVETQSQSSAGIRCPSCSQQLTRVYVYPLSLSALEEAAKHNHNELAVNSKKRKRELSMNFDIDGDDHHHNNSEENAHASASPFLLWSDLPSEGGVSQSSSDRLHFRTGRWSSSETDFVDLLIHSFDNSTLPLPHGIKLNEFLRDVLLCKSSRLTKKMKNAKLSHRSYKLQMTNALYDFKAVSDAQDSFLQSISSQVTRLVLKFNMTRMWRVHFLNLCLQAGYEPVFKQDWLDSLDELDRRVTAAEESVRQCRRNRLVKALRKDSQQESIDGVFFGRSPESPSKSTSKESSPVEKRRRSLSSVALASLTTHFTHEVKQQQQQQQQQQQSATLFQKPVESIKVEKNTEVEDTGFNNGDFSITSIKVKPTPMDDMNSFGGDNFSIDFLDLDESVSGDTLLSLREDCPHRSTRGKNFFLSRIMKYIEGQNMPFHYIDCWVPFNKPDEQTLGLHSFRLVHGGDDFHVDLSSLTEYHLHEFGVYSKQFSFGPGAGLPGRCYTTSQCCWESDIQNASPQHFKRLGGAKFAGIQTAVGIPISCSKVGTIVIGMYSLLNVSYDENLMRKCLIEFQKFNPEPKWSLSIDMPSYDNEPSTKAPQPVVTSMQSSVHSSDSQSESCKSNELSTCSTVNSISSEQAMEIANLFAEHMPSLDDGGHKSEVIRSLRMLLLKCPHNVPQHILSKLVILRKSYEGYLKVQRQKSDVVNLLISDWEFLSKEDEQKSPWGAQTMTHVNYSVKNTTPRKVSQVSPRIEDFSSNANSADASSFMLPPPSVKSFSDEVPTNSLNSYHYVSNTSLAADEMGGKLAAQARSSNTSE